MSIKNLIASGCSFTSDGIGGMSPTVDGEGGCSFIHGNSTPQTWAGFLAQKLQVNSLVNSATSGHGNILIANTILELTKRFNYKTSDTLIVFNLADPARLDLPCDFTHLDANTNSIPWDKNIIPYSYFNQSQSKIVTKLKIHSGIEQIEQLTSNTVEFLFNLLEYQKWNYYFLMMDNYLDHEYLGPIIKQFQHRLIRLNPGTSMLEFCQLTNNSKSKFDNHPTIEGHKIIANAIYDRIQV